MDGRVGADRRELRARERASLQGNQVPDRPAAESRPTLARHRRGERGAEERVGDARVRELVRAKAGLGAV